MNFRKIKRSVYVLIFAIVVIFLKSANFDVSIKDLLVQDTIHAQNGGIEKVKVEKIVDGDTIWVKRNSESYKVRLIGIDAPESVHPDKSKNTADGKKASDYVKSTLAAGQVVYLQKDKSDTDKYGRLLRYVWLQSPKDIENKQEIKEKMLNAIIVEAGYARAVMYKPDTRYKDIFSDLESAAKKAKKGIWE